MFIITDFNLISNHVNIYKLVNLSGDIITRITFSDKYKLPEDGVYSINSYGPIYAKIRKKLESVNYVDCNTGFNYRFLNNEIYITKIDLKHIVDNNNIYTIVRYSTFENGKIPFEFIYLPNLKTLLIEDDPLTSAVWGLTRLTNLTLYGVELSYNNMCGINRLTNLETLEIEYCSGEISDQIFDLCNLSRLIISETPINTLTGISKLYRLRYLVLTDSDITELPREIGNLTRLQYLDISKNVNLAKIPSEIRYLTNIGTVIKGKQLPKCRFIS